MSKDKPGNQKNIDDVLSSIDSLLDTATDASLDDAVPSTPAPPKPAAEPKNTVKTSTPAKKPTATRVTKARSASKIQASKPARTQQQTNPAGIQKTVSQVDKKPQDSSESAARPDKPKDPANPARNRSPSKQSTSTAPEPSDISGSEIEAPADSEATQTQQADSKKSPVRTADPDNHLNFTTVDDDLSSAMRELPVLDDIVSEQDLALIGSGKEPPKKVLTEAFKKLSLTDKLIEILQNQLSDYDISKLEYQYIHELFEELLEKEKDRDKF